MNYKKILGLFLTLPLDSLTIDYICELTTLSVDEVKKNLKKLSDKGVIKGKRKFKLCV